ncbi:MAG: ATP-binding protein [Oscillospiraceae bacterium]
MLRTIIEINETKCNGCGLCAAACQEGAIGMVDGKAKLLRDDYCDGLGNCLPACPTGAISFVEREAAPFDELAVKIAQLKKQSAGLSPAPQGCPGSRAQTLPVRQDDSEEGAVPSQLRQWPVQLKLAPVSAPYFDGADLLVAADCAAYARGSFHRDFMRGKVTLIGCPKLDEGDYADKLTEILRRNAVRSLTVVRMEVPCCGGIQRAALQALQQSGKDLPFAVRVLSTDGRVLE